MAFDLVHYFQDQLLIQKPTLLDHYPPEKKQQYLQEINLLVLGKLITLWRENAKILYQEIHALEHLYIQNIARHLTTAPSNQSQLAKVELEHCISEILSLQLIELKQLDLTGNLGPNALNQLLLGQIQYLSAQAEDWIWTTNNLVELKGTKPQTIEEISLTPRIQEFNHMTTQDQTHHHAVDEVIENPVPTWAKILEPIVALAILWILANALCNVFA